MGPTFPIMVFGATALVSAALSLFLPETKTRRLPDTIEEGERVKVSLTDGFVSKKKKEVEV